MRNKYIHGRFTNSKEYILFDLDGTITDSKMGITKSVQYALEAFGIYENNLDHLCRFIGPPLDESFKRFYNFDDITAKKLIKKYRERYQDIGIYENQLYTGMDSLLEELVNKGNQLILATSKPQIFAERILKHFNLAQYFKLIAGSELDGTRTKKVEVIRFVLQEAGIKDLSSVVMVGDREHDILGANETGIESIGVLYGYGSCHELQSAGATMIVETVEDLKKILMPRKETLYISDLDGTLLNSEMEISDYTTHALNELIAKGVHFSIATARSAATALKILSDVHFNVPVILMNGVIIYDISKKEFIKIELIPLQAVQGILAVLKNHNMSGFMYAMDHESTITYYENLNTKVMSDFYDERVAKYYKSFEQVQSFSDKVDGNKIIYFTLIDTYERLAPILSDLKTYSAIDSVLYRDIYTENMWYLEIHSKNASKYHAVKFIREYGQYDEIIGFGDNLNDIPLFYACDEGYAVSGAVDELKNLATKVIGENNADSVAKFIAEREGRGSFV